MLTVTEIREVAAKAAAGDRRSITLFRELATVVGIEGRPGGWIYLPDGRRPIGHGWRAAAELFRDPRGWTGKDLVVEMSKRSATADDIAAAEVEAHDDAAAYAQNAAYVERSYDGRGMHLGIEHVAPATIAAAHDEALAEDARRRRGVGSPKIVIVFDRVGARRYGDALRLEVPRALCATPDELARAVYQHARRYVVSRAFDVTVDAALGLVLIEDGRFGRGTFSVCDCDGSHSPVEGGHSVACRARELLDLFGEPTLDEQHVEALAMNANPLKREPAPRAERLDAAFKAFVDLADSGGPGTSRGLIAAVEGATTVAEEQLAKAVADAGIPSHSLTALDVRRVLDLLGFAVK